MKKAGCPSCGAAVDPYLGPAPVVLGDRVVMCCSTACAEAVLKGSSASERALGERAVIQEVASGQVGQGDAERGRRLRRGWFGRLRIGPKGSNLLAAGVILLLLAIYLVMEYASVAPSLSTGWEEPLAWPGSAADPPTDQIEGSTTLLALSGALPPGILSEGSRASSPPLFPELRRRSIAILEGFLHSEVIRFRLAAADVLAELGDALALAVLKGDLDSELWTTRQMAAEPLARMGHAEGVSALKDGLASPRPTVKWSAAYALARVGDPSGVHVLRQIAHVRIHRITANEALVRLGDQRGRRFLRAMLTSEEPLYNRMRAAVALGLAGDHEALPLLEASLDGSQMNLGVALALQRLGSPRAPPALEQALEHAALRVEAARALRGQGEVSGLRALGRSLESDHPETRLSGAAAMVILTASVEGDEGAEASREVP